VTIDGDKVTRNPGYYVIAHASKFVRPGSVRVHSSEMAGLPNVAFKTPEGRVVLIALNENQSARDFQIRVGSRAARLEVDGGAVVTCVWTE
jgi:glucosylceramidase